MRAALYAFIVHAWDHAFWLLTNVALVVPSVYAWIPEQRRRWISQHPILGKLLLPKWYAYPIALVGIFITAFLTFGDEYTAATSLRSQIFGASGYKEQISSMSEKYSADEATINGPRGLRSQLEELLTRNGADSTSSASSSIAKAPTAVVRVFGAEERNSPNREWAELDKQDLNALQDALKKLTPQLIGIACATPYCAHLGSDLESAFNGAGWQASVHHGGGLGVDGVTGLVVYSCNGSADQVKIAIENNTKLKVQAQNDKSCNDHDYLVVGEKPF